MKDQINKLELSPEENQSYAYFDYENATGEIYVSLALTSAETHLIREHLLNNNGRLPVSVVITLSSEKSFSGAPISSMFVQVNTEASIGGN